MTPESSGTDSVWRLGWRVAAAFIVAAVASVVVRARRKRRRSAETVV